MAMGIPRTISRRFDSQSISIVNDPQGPENFGEMVVDMIRSNLPTNANDSTRAGVTFNSPELDSDESVGLSITNIVRSMELMTQSNKSPLELQKPRLEIVIKYLIPPTGSGKTRSVQCSNT
ncbi:hypothetical protein B9Z55_015559 [Caenorhabditis nigoni]|uniref:Uncharacterized protein n=1 Tax=Caenorhabditis nigoni TaxID=1611254 RepID=A0A2G5UAT5_9PELO|nr:hypothetical protein B9Z55_015559 [Caenorhabditis nigoni]